jgi:putative glutamine amidotransferase
VSLSANRPLVGVVSDRKMQGPHPFHMVGEKYLAAVADAADAYPVALPSLAEGFDVLDIIDRLDGILLTGSQSMLEPHHYEGESSKPGTWHDPHRDRASLSLIPAAIEAGMPLLAICRGFQEMNVAFGGSLHQEVASAGAFQVHHENSDDPVEVQYGPSHNVSFPSGSYLERISGHSEFRVNSLHHQGVDRLGEGLRVEAVAEDGLVEAFSVEGASGFALGVQWHPEWRPLDNALSVALFQAFGDACRSYRLREL